MRGVYKTFTFADGKITVTFKIVPSHEFTVVRNQRQEIKENPPPDKKGLLVYSPARNENEVRVSLLIPIYTLQQHNIKITITPSLTIKYQTYYITIGDIITREVYLKFSELLKPYAISVREKSIQHYNTRYIEVKWRENPLTFTTDLDPVTTLTDTLENTVTEVVNKLFTDPNILQELQQHAENALAEGKKLNINITITYSLDTSMFVCSNSYAQLIVTTIPIPLNEMKDRLEGKDSNFIKTYLFFRLGNNEEHREFISQLIQIPEIECIAENKIESITGLRPYILRYWEI